MEHSRDHDLVGMDPDKMQALINELKSTQHTIAAFTAEFAAPLSAQGISLNTVHQAEHWTTDQVTKLTERLQKLHEAGHTVPPMAGQGGQGGNGQGAPPAGVVSPPVSAGSGPGNSTPVAHGHAGKPASNGADTSGTGTDTGAGTAAGGSAAAAGGYPYTGAGPPAAYGPAPHAAAHQPPASARQHAALDAKRVSHAAQHGQSLPERVWDDIERNAADPQYAGALLAALGAAGLALLGASVARSRKKSKDQAEADRRQAALDELLRNAGEYGASAGGVPAGTPQLPQPEPELAGDPAEPRLRLVPSGGEGSAR
ncbi:MAG TPA: hypothetical protein VGI31_09610 [Streptosporangiaceae bacterium]